LRVAYDDSWGPINQALAYLDRPRAKSLYDAIFFQQQIKFQYPPTSLLFVDGLRQLRGDYIALANGLNLISWFFVLGTVLVRCSFTCM
jgi:alpha-1,2-mannosyltransferase